MALLFSVSFISYIISHTTTNSIHAAPTDQHLELTHRFSEDAVITSKDNNELVFPSQDGVLDQIHTAAVKNILANSTDLESELMDRVGGGETGRGGRRVVNNFGDNVGLEVEADRQLASTQLKYILHWNEAYGSKGRKQF